MSDVNPDEVEPAESEAPEPAGSADAADPGAPTRYALRRAPRYYSFGITGLTLGVLVGLVIGSLPSDPVLDRQTYTAGSVLGYFVVAFGLFGILIGLGLALLVERRAARRRR